MTKFIYGLALATIMGSTYAFSAPGDGSCRQHPDAPYCQGDGEGGVGGNGGSAQQGQQQQQGQAQGQQQELNNEVSQRTDVRSQSDSDSNSESRSDASSNSSATGGSVRNDNSVQGGRTDSSATASGGNATGGEGGDSRVDTRVDTKVSTVNEGNDSDITVEGDTDNSSYSYKEETAASSAASVFAGYCQSGTSGQIEAGGFSVVNPEAFCNNIRMAAVYQEAYAWELAHGKVTCSDEAGTVWVEDQYADTCVNEQAAEYYTLYTGHLEDAHELLVNTDAVATVDAVAGYLMRPLAIIALLLLL
jgi:hypothetical protein